MAVCMAPSISPPAISAVCWSGRCPEFLNLKAVDGFAQF
jgi:hypothetical protein